MTDEPKNPKARLLFRWLAAVSCPFFFLAALFEAFPQLVGGNGEPDFLFVALLTWGGVLFAGIYSTGKLG